VSLGDLEIVAGRERHRVPAVMPTFGDAGGSEVVVAYEAPSTVSLHVYGREIADGDLMCSLGARKAAVRMDLRLAARIVAEGLARGLTLPRDEARALAEALGKQQG
jgi:hypothetical protein